MISSSTSWGQETHYSALPLIKRKGDHVTHHQELTTLPRTRYNKINGLRTFANFATIMSSMFRRSVLENKLDEL